MGNLVVRFVALAFTILIFLGLLSAKIAYGAGSNYGGPPPTQPPIAPSSSQATVLKICQIPLSGGTCSTPVGPGEAIVSVPPGSFSNSGCDPTTVVITSLSPGSVDISGIDPSEIIELIEVGAYCDGAPVSGDFNPPIEVSLEVPIGDVTPASTLEVLEDGSSDSPSPAPPTVGSWWSVNSGTSWTLDNSSGTSMGPAVNQPVLSPEAFAATGGGESFAAASSVISDPYFALVEVPANGTQQLNDCKIGKAGGTCMATIGGNKIVVRVPPGSFDGLTCDPADVVITNVAPSGVSLPVKNGDTVFVFGLGVLCNGVPVTEHFSPPISTSVAVVVPGKVASSQIKVFSVGAFGGVSPSVGNETWKLYDLTQAPEASPTESGATGTETSFAASLPNIIGDPYFAFSITLQQSPAISLKSGQKSSGSLVAIGAGILAFLFLLLFFLLAKRRKHAN